MGRTNYNYVLWVPVPAGFEALYAGQETAYPEATQAEKDALTAGSVAQRTGNYQREPGTTLAQVQTDLIAAVAAFSTEVDNDNPKERYGTYWEQGVGWTAAGVSKT